MEIIQSFCNDIKNYKELRLLSDDLKIFIISNAHLSIDKYKEKKGIYYRRSSVVLDYFYKNFNFDFFFNIFYIPFIEECRVLNLPKILKYFLNDKDLMYNSITNIKMLSNNNKKFEQVSYNILGKEKTICITPRFFYMYDKETVKKYLPKYNLQDIKKDYFFSTDLLPKNNIKEFDIIHRPTLFNYYKILVEQTKQSELDKIRCINNINLAKIIFYEVSFIIEKISENKNIDSTLHRSTVILNLENYSKNETVDVYYMESSMQHNKEWLELEDVILKSIKADIEINLDFKKVNIVSFDSEKCPRINIQGENSGTCGIWSMFLFYTYVLHPNRSIIFKTLSLMSQIERNKLLIVFIYAYSLVDKEKTLTNSSNKYIDNVINYLKENSW